MISFGIMTVLLVTMACVVHYDLLDFYPMYPYGRYAYTTVGERQDQRQYQPSLDSVDEWVPKPGTDPNVHQYPGPVVLQMGDLDDYDDNDDFWSEVTDPDDDDKWNHAGRDRCSVVAGAKAADDDTGVCPARGDSGYPRPAPSFPTADVPPPLRDDDIHRGDEDRNVNDDDYDSDDYDDYDSFVAPGEEHDDDVF